MVYLTELQYIIVVVLHVLSALVGVGAVTVTDYLHILGLRGKELEKKLLVVYEPLGRLIIAALAGMIITGTLLVINRPENLLQPLFQTKVALVAIICINGLLLHRKVYPEMIECAEGKRSYCSPQVLILSSLFGSISIVTWYAIVILSITREHAYSAYSFLFYYALALLITFIIALKMETSAHKWG